jgi:hypothetical protein
MTRKQSVCKALELLGGMKHTQEIEDVMDKLAEIREELPFTKWSAETIHDTLTQFAVERGRNPTTTDLKRGELPPHSVIKLRFGMTAKEFLLTYYPPQPKASASVLYGNKAKEEWTADFIRQYKNIKPHSGSKYDLAKGADSPSWQTIAKYNGVKGWRGLISHFNLTSYRPKRKGDGIPFNVTHTIRIDGRLITDDEWHEYLALRH